MKTKFNQSKLKLAIVSAIMACSAGLSASSYAATTTANMTVSSSVLTACTMTTGDLAFGTYDPSTQTNVDGTATITSTCTLGGGATITLGQGGNAFTGSSDTVPLRQMADGTNRLKYHLYGDNDFSGVFGNTEATGQSANGTGGAVTTTVYGRIVGTENAGTPAGTYADGVLVTLTY
jgi:spore coat protein U-like protein